MSGEQYNPIQRFNRAFILYEDLLEAAQEQLAPAMEAGFPLTNIDLRDPNVVARITGAGTAASPKELKFDLGEEKIIESVAAVANNITLDGGVSVQLGIDDGDSSPPWEETHNLFHSQKNILSNPAFERFTGFTSSDPAPSTVQADAWFVISGSPALRVLPYQTDIDNFSPPNDPSNYINRVYGKFIPNVSGASVAAVSQWFLPKTSGRVKGSFWVSTKGNSYSETIQMAVLQLNASFGTLALDIVFSESNFSINGWQQVTFDLATSNQDVRYMAIFIQNTGAPDSGDFLYLDNFVLTLYPKEGENYDQYIQPSVSGNLFKSLDHAVPARYIKFSFVNGSALVPAPDAFIELGRILVGRTLPLGVQRGARNNENSGDIIQLTTGGSPIEIKRSGIDKQFQLVFKRFKVGEVDDILGALQELQGDQVFISMFHESKRERAFVGSIQPPISAVEARKKDFFDISMKFKKEGQ